MKIQPKTPGTRRSALASTAADLRELKGNSRATVEELQAFLRELKGKSPQEMLGVVSASQLARSLVFSSALVGGAILLFTAIPFFFGSDGKEPPAAAVKSAPAPVAPPPPVAAKPPVETKADPLSTLGVGEELTAPPDQNPLENKGDDFLKDLE
ncbi:MAG: hypothetical protein ACKV19_18555 [Verrucomicrobiales bacterium]